MTDEFIDQIYEAAFVPECWPGVLERLGEVIDAPAATLLVFDDLKPIRFSTTSLAHDVMEDFCVSGAWKQNQRIQYFHEKPITGFVIAQDYYPAGFLERDAPFQALCQLGLDSQAGTIIPMPSGELVAFVLQKWAGDGRVTADNIESLDRVYPHLARAGLIAARLGLARAEATVSALANIGLPAAVMSRSGRVLSVNDLMTGLPEIFLPVAFGGMAITDPGANRLFQQAVEAARSDVEPLVRSIPLHARGDRVAMVLHVLPLRRAAHDIFSGADILIAATAMHASNLVPSPTILTGLFDLTPAEAKLAVSLASGYSLATAALQAGITTKTARTYLERIFRKTGTGQQGHLVALLKSVHPVAAGQGPSTPP